MSLEDADVPDPTLFHISTAAPGEPFTYTLRVANTGMQVLDTLTMTATLPGGASLIAINDGGIVAGPVITWTATDLAPGEVIERSYVVSATTSVTTGPYGVMAISGSTTVTSSGRLPITTLINTPRLHLRTFAESEVEVGSVFGQLFLLVNFGQGNGAGVTTPIDVRAKIPPGAGIVAINSGSIVGDEARWQISGLSGGVPCFWVWMCAPELLAASSASPITGRRSAVRHPLSAQPQARQSSPKHAVISP